MVNFVGFSKIARLSRDIVITEKIDGTNAQVYVPEDPSEPILAGSRTRWITPEADNHGFAKWVLDNTDELRTLGPGRHFGEWWGQGINRSYGLKEKRFSLFNVKRWGESRPSCCHVVPTLYQGEFGEDACWSSLDLLERDGSVAAPGFMNPEGIVIYHTAANVMFKKTLKNDEQPKSTINQLHEPKGNV